MNNVNAKIADLILDEETKYFNKINNGAKSYLKELIPMMHDNGANICYSFFQLHQPQFS